MTRTRISKALVILYLAVVAKALLSSRTPAPIPRPGSNLAMEWANHESIIKSTLINRIMYLSGPLETLGNIFIFTILLLALSQIVPRMKSINLALICAGISLGVETAQIFIPGRVSSLIDVDCNFLGIALALIMLKKCPQLIYKK